MEIQIANDRWKFGRHDRIVIKNQVYRPIRKEGRSHLLQLIVEDVQDDHFITKTDAEISELMRRKLFRHDAGYFSKPQARIRVRGDSSDLTDLSEDELRTVLWKAEWCRRFDSARADSSAPWRPTMSLPDIAFFIDRQKKALDRWHVDRFGERRPAGRRRQGGPQKEFDYPSASTLRNWLIKWHAAEEQLDAFRLRYHHCGNRTQLDPRAERVVSECVEKFASSLRPRQRDIYEDVEAKLSKLNLSLPADVAPIYVSRNAIRARIKKIDPFFRDFNRLGKDRALRRFTPIGEGLTVINPLERVEIDDWDFDLHALITNSGVWRKLSPKNRELVPRVRCTATVAIDVATRCIVGFNLSPNPPSTASSKTALRRVMCDKSALANAAGCKSDWRMQGRPWSVVTDSGPAFLGEFETSVARSGITRLLPEADPRKRGTIEAFFRYFKRVCRYFAGQTFANVVEKGDYQSEAMASLTFDELERSAIRFIVDSYHHRAHRGLGRCTPYGMWQRLTKDGTFPPPRAIELRAAFGIRVARTLGKHGVSYLDLAYNSAELNRVFLRHENKELDVFVERKNLAKAIKGLSNFEAWPINFILSGTPETTEIARLDQQFERRGKFLFLSDITMPEEKALVDRMIREMAGAIGMATDRLIASDVPERVAHAARYRYGRIAQMVLAGIQVAIHKGANELVREHFAYAYLELSHARGRDQMNPFLVDDWRNLPAGYFLIEEQRGT